MRQSERAERHREAAAPLGDRFDGLTLLREDGSPTYQLASVVDDIDFGITHVVRGNDHRPNEPLHRRLFEALGATPPEFVHHGLILGDGRTQARQAAPGATVASLRDEGFRPRRCARTSRSSGCRATTSISTPHACAGSRPRRSPGCRDEELAARVGVPVSVSPVLRGARDLAEARAYAELVLEPRRGRGRLSRDAGALPRAGRGRPGTESGRAGAEGGRRRPESAPPRA